VTPQTISITSGDRCFATVTRVGDDFYIIGGSTREKEKIDVLKLLF